jgi:hypothetical protein
VPLELVQDLAARRGHVEPPCVVLEHVVDEARGEFEEVLAAERLEDSLDAHAILDDAFPHPLADLVVVKGPGEDPLGRVPERGAAAASGLILAAGDLEEGDGLGVDGANSARWEFPLSPAPFATVRARCLLGSARNR